MRQMTAAPGSGADTTGNTRGWLGRCKGPLMACILLAFFLTLSISSRISPVAPQCVATYPDDSIHVPIPSRAPATA